MLCSLVPSVSDVLGRPDGILLAVTLLIAAITPEEGVSMTVVDPELLRELQRAGSRPVPVLIVCQTDCEPVVKTLAERGITITSAESAVVGSVGAKITADQLGVLKGVPGISAVELDQEARALHQ